MTEGGFSSTAQNTGHSRNPISSESRFCYLEFWTQEMLLFNKNDSTKMIFLNDPFPQKRCIHIFSSNHLMGVMLSSSISLVVCIICPFCDYTWIVFSYLSPGNLMHLLQLCVPWYFATPIVRSHLLLLDVVLPQKASTWRSSRFNPNPKAGACPNHSFAVRAVVSQSGTPVFLMQNLLIDFPTLQTGRVKVCVRDLRWFISRYLFQRVVNWRMGFPPDIDQDGHIRIYLPFELNI